MGFGPRRRARKGAARPVAAALRRYGARMTRPRLDNRRARRLFLDRHLLLRSEAGVGRGADLCGVLDDLGFVQVDSVSTLARAHDMILWARRGRYRPKALHHLVARDRTAFEHWTHDAAIVPMRFHPMWRLKFAREEARMRARWLHCAKRWAPARCGSPPARIQGKTSRSWRHTGRLRRTCRTC